MKYKVIYILSLIFMIITAISFERVPFKSNRYHQHKEAASKSVCNVHNDDVFCTHLPLMNITTEGPMPSPFITDENGTPLKDTKGSTIQNDEMVAAKVEYFDKSTGNNHITDTPAIFEKALIRPRGRSSRSHDKKGYYLKFKEENCIDNKNVAISGMTEDSDWVLHGPYLDKTLIRNYLAYNLAGEIMEYSPNARFFEMFINGEYQGVYVLIEKNQYNDEGRIKVTETDINMTSTSYILALDTGSKDELHRLETFTYYTGKNGRRSSLSEQLEIVYPSTTLTEVQKEYIQNDMSKFEKALSSFDSGDKKTGYPSFIDVQSFIDYFIINEFTMNSDAARLSTYFYKDIRGKMKIAVWDFNSAFDNYITSMSEPHGFLMADKFWYEYLLKDKNFVDAIVKRYGELRKTFLSDEYLLNYIDETIEYLGPAIDRNYEKWGYTFSEEHNMLEPDERNPENYEEAVKQLKDAIVERGAYLDKNIETLYALAHDSINKKFKHNTGEVK
ncbi:MAG: CotH kinase family protein [Clostridium sp.]|uniref:CotH kinase family protein n=1 Tax=Clostridium sp. TaxID=1506 RepID=UPI003058E2FD